MRISATNKVIVFANYCVPESRSNAITDDVVFRGGDNIFKRKYRRHGVVLMFEKNLRPRDVREFRVGRETDKPQGRPQEREKNVI